MEVAGNGGEDGEEVSGKMGMDKISPRAHSCADSSVSQIPSCSPCTYGWFLSNTFINPFAVLAFGCVADVWFCFFFFWFLLRSFRLPRRELCRIHGGAFDCKMINETRNKLEHRERRELITITCTFTNKQRSTIQPQCGKHQHISLKEWAATVYNTIALSLHPSVCVRFKLESRHDNGARATVTRRETIYLFSSWCISLRRKRQQQQPSLCRTRNSDGFLGQSVSPPTFDEW